MHFMDDDNSHCGFRGGEYRGLHNRLGFFVIDCRTFTNNLGDIDETTAHHEVGNPIIGTIGVADQASGKGASGRLLASTFWADEEIGMGGAFGKRPQTGDSSVLSDDGIPDAVQTSPL